MRRAGSGSEGGGRGLAKWRKRSQVASPYLFLAPAALFVAAFIVYPLVTGIRLSLENASSLSGGPFVGAQNFISVAEQGLFQRALLNNMEFFGGSVLLLTPVALVLALCLYSKWSVLRGGVRLILLVPMSASTVVVAIIFGQLFSGRFGLYNLWLRELGVGGVGWLTDPNVVMISLIVLAMWGYMGLNVAYVLAGLRGVAVDTIEASRVDGATYLRTLFSVVLPQLRGVMVFIAIQAIVGSLNLFARPDVLTSGGPENRSLTVVMYVYQQALQNFSLGTAAAAGFLVMAVIVGMSGIVLWLGTLEHRWLRLGGATRIGGARRFRVWEGVHEWSGS